ncbi:Ogt [Symbiodinium sp. CCMP2592]|nr:Ogt [Symbiodinium sp. CCMP2592]
MARVSGAEEIPDGASARVGMFSARFDRGPTEALFRGVYQLLKEKNYPVLMVDAAAGRNFGEMTSAYLGKLKRERGVLLAVCTWNYAEKTDSRYSSYEELRVAHENGLQILPLRMCDDPWPPEPPCGPDHQYDQMGAGAGLVDLAIGPATVYVDCRGKDENCIAARIAETLRPGGPRRPSGHGKGASPGASSAAGYSQQDTEAVVRPSASPSPADIAEAKAWYDLGKKGGGKRNGFSYSKKACYVKALEVDEKYARAWNGLGYEGGGTVKGQAYDAKACYRKTLEVDEKYAVAWRNLGLVGGGTVKGRDYDAKACFVKALELNENFANAWNRLGVVDGGTVKGQAYDEKACYVKALEVDEKHAGAWNNLGNEGGGTVKGRDYNAKECILKALELDEKNANYWDSLGDLAGGGTVKGWAYDKKDCFVRALELSENHMFETVFWRNLGNAGGGTVRGTHYSPDECKAKAEGK